MMKLSDLKKILPALTIVEFRLENGTPVPKHFHVTEIGIVHKHFIDCGGTIRKDTRINFQLWNANDYKHRLKPDKLLKIICLSEEKLGIPDAEIEVEYQRETVGKYELDFDGKHFILRSKQTACLANEVCDVPDEKQKVNLLEHGQAGCTPGSGCC